MLIQPLRRPRLYTVARSIWNWSWSLCSSQSSPPSLHKAHIREFLLCTQGEVKTGVFFGWPWPRCAYVPELSAQAGRGGSNCSFGQMGKEEEQGMRVLELRMWSMVPVLPGLVWHPPRSGGGGVLNKHLTQTLAPAHRRTGFWIFYFVISTYHYRIPVKTGWTDFII